MDVSYLRASTIGAYKDCQFKYFLNYVCQFDSIAGKKANMGTIVHHVAELLAKAKKTGHYKLNDKYTDRYYLLDICWKRYTTKIYPTMDWTKADYNFCKKMVDIIWNSNMNPLTLPIKATEKQFDIEIHKPGFQYDYVNSITGVREKGYLKLRGTIDLITEHDWTLWVYDWKTGERKDWISGAPKELDDFQLDMQLRLYDLALSIIYPDIPYRMFTIVFVRDGGPFTVTFDSEEQKKTLDELRRVFNHIQSNTSPKRLKDDRSRKEQHWKCKYVCQFGKTKDANGEILCDKYYKILRANNIEKATKILYDISVEGKSITSRRNDYSRSNIAQGKLI